MRTILASLLCIILAVSSCNKDKKNCGTVETKAPAAEVAAVKQYLTDNSLTAVEDSRGFFFDISNAGTGDRPNVCSDVTVNYTGKLTNGTIFDANNNVSFNLSNLIIGWQEGIPLIAKGGTITLYLPPSLGYGNSAVGTIPANSILIFTINLL